MFGETISPSASTSITSGFVLSLFVTPDGWTLLLLSDSSFRSASRSRPSAEARDQANSSSVKGRSTFFPFSRTRFCIAGLELATSVPVVCEGGSASGKRRKGVLKKESSLDWLAPLETFAFLLWRPGDNVDAKERLGMLRREPDREMLKRENVR